MDSRSNARLAHSAGCRLGWRCTWAPRRRNSRPCDWDTTVSHAVNSRTARVLLILSLVVLNCAGFLFGVLLAPILLPLVVPAFRNQPITRDQFAHATHVALVSGAGCTVTVLLILVHLVHSGEEFLLPTFRRAQ